MFIKILSLILLLTLASCSNLSSNDAAELLKTSLLLIALVAFNFSAFRSGKAYKYLAIWLTIFITLFAGYSYRDVILKSRLASEFMPNRAISIGSGEVVITRSNNGHFMVRSEVNGVIVNFLLDTGATDIALDPLDAKRIGLDPDALNYIRIYQTANGKIRAAPVKLKSVRIGELEFYNVRASVNENSSGGSLLGMSFLDLFTSYEVRGDKIYLRR